MRIALVAPSFFGYSKDILHEIESLGHTGFLFCDRPSENVFFKSLGRINYSLLNPSIDRYFNKFLEAVIEKHPDVILVVGGMSFCFSRMQVERLKNACHAQLVAYLWDSLKNCQRIGDSIDLFDRVYSFEPHDCRSAGLHFLPLFYANAYGNIPLEPPSCYQYDACFVGSVHQTSKFLYVNSVVEILRQEGARVFTHYYIPSKSVGLLCRMQNRKYQQVELRCDVLSRAQVVNLFRISKTIIDAPQACQSGLTMRTIETVGAQRKLITANPEISNYDFFAYGQMKYLPYAEDLDMSFITADPAGIPDDVRLRYSIHSWMERVLEIMR